MKPMLDIVSVGMVTAVGLDAPSSCAAMRAKLDGFQETRFVGPANDWLIGAPVTLPRQWTGTKRLAHMAAAAITEVTDHAPEARGRTTLVLCLAEEDRPGRPILDYASFLRQIAEITDTEAPTRPRVVAHGRPSGHVALEQARRLLAESTTPYVMIVGIDSYLTTQTIGHFIGKGRLLTTDNPNGFIPGEASAAILCSRPSGGGLRLNGLGLSREAAYIYNDKDLPLRGDGMASAYRTAFDEIGMEMRHLGYRISDLIGEQYWFKQSALASLRLVRGRSEFQDLWSPGEFLGNIGAAAAPLMVGMAYMAAAKGYSAGDPVLVEASNDAGACAAAVLTAGTRS